MTSSIVRALCILMAISVLATSAHALPPWKPKFKEMFVDDGSKSLQEAFANKVIGSCKVCHIDGRDKSVRNPFGMALDELIPGNAGQRLKIAAEGGDDAKVAMQAKLDSEYLAALAKVLKIPSPCGGGTYGERIKAGNLPFIPAAPNQLLYDEQQQEFQLLFNGEDLNGWKSQSDKHFRVEDGKLIADGTKGRSMLYYIGSDGKASFDNYELRMQVLTHPGGNSGIYFRTKWQDKGYPDGFGYEAQIANTHKNRSKTGSIYRYKSIAEPVKDDEWFDYHIIADGRKITTRVNGRVVAEYVEPDDEKKRKPAGGLIAIQCHDPAIVEFRSIRIKSLDQANE